VSRLAAALPLHWCLLRILIFRCECDGIALLELGWRCGCGAIGADCLAGNESIDLFQDRLECGTDIRVSKGGGLDEEQLRRNEKGNGNEHEHETDKRKRYGRVGITHSCMDDHCSAGVRDEMRSS
jgi:hypothetical protein